MKLGNIDSIYMDLAYKFVEIKKFYSNSIRSTQQINKTYIMKKLFIIFSLVIFFATTSQAQKFLVGGGLVYGTEVEKGGIDIRGDIRINQNWAIVPNINFFFPESSDNFKSGFTGINIDGHYLVDLGSGANVYPLFGLNFGHSSFKNKINDTKSTNTELGINIGGGIEYFFSRKVAGFFELKYVIITDYDQGVLGFGVLYNL